MKHALSAFPALHVTGRLYVLFLMLVVGIPTCQAQAPSLKDVLSQLDEAVANRSEVRNRSLQEIDKFRDELMHTDGVSDYDITEKMMWRFEHISADSSVYYAGKMVEAAGDDSQKIQSSKIQLAYFMVRYGQYAWAEDLLNSLGTDISRENRFRFYQVWDLLCTWKNEHLSPNNEIRNSNFWSYSDSMNLYRQNPLDISIANAQRLIYTDPKAAIDTIWTVSHRLNDEYQWRFLGKRMGLCYQELGMRDSAEYFLALSALDDMQLGVVEHTSLYLLSQMLLEDGDIGRAYHYTRAALDDALACGVRLRLEQVSRSMPTVLDSYYKELEMRQQRINRILGLLATLLLIVSGALYYVYRINKRLDILRQKERELNDNLKQKERELNEALRKQTVLVDEVSKSSKMKETLVGQYMRQCVGNIQQLEHYRLSLMKVANQGNMDKLVTAIKKSEFIEKELENFYHDFDESFLQIFPNFVENVNALLREDCRIVVPEGKLLTVDLRIQALIRLGLTETEEIAQFLRYSNRTIYNYRSRMRNSALCRPEEFEERVKAL